MRNGSTHRTTDGMNRRTYLKVVGSSSVALTATAGCLGNIGGGGGQTITPGTAPGFPPFEMTQDGELVGFDIDLLEAVVAETDYTIDEWATFEFSSLIPALNSDKIDVIAAAMTITDERDETIDFSDPYYNADQAILVRAGGDFQPGSLDDLTGHPIGAQKGTTGESVIKSNLLDPGKLEQENYNGYDNYVFAVEDLENGNIDAVVLDTPVADTFAAQRDVSVSFTVSTGERYGFGIRDGESELQSALNSGLQTVMDGDQYQEITNKWFGQE